MVKIIKIESIQELLDCLIHDALSEKVFRGAGLTSYQLIPSALRKDNNHILDALKYRLFPRRQDIEELQIKAEFTLLSYFYNECDMNGLRVPNVNVIRKIVHRRSRKEIYDFNPQYHPIDDMEIWMPDDILELAALAQHYGIPTRLLDWTYDYKTALYFAAISNIKNKSSTDLVVWSISTSDITFSNKTNNSQINLPLRFIRPPYVDNENLNAQKGLLSIWETKMKDIKPPVYHQIDDSSYEEKIKQFIEINDLVEDNKVILNKYIINNTLAKDIAIRLNAEGCNHGKYFPGYQGVVDYIMHEALVYEY